MIVIVYLPMYEPRHKKINTLQESWNQDSFENSTIFSFPLSHPSASRSVGLQARFLSEMMVTVIIYQIQDPAQQRGENAVSVAFIYFI
jgi:hypothetical protein